MNIIKNFWPTMRDFIDIVSGKNSKKRDSHDGRNFSE